MYRTSKKTHLLLIAILLMALTAVACSPSEAEKLNKTGNDAFAEQAFQDALAAYQTAQIEDPELAEPYYNAANALYRQGAYEAALEQMNMALSFAEQETLAQAGYFNLGNTSYNAQDLESAIASYRQALLINPDDQDAKYNLELALQQQQQQQNEQEQDQQEQDQQDQEQSDQGEQQDQQQSDQGEQQQEQQNQDGEGQEEQEKQDQGEQPSEEQQSENGEQQDQQQNQDGEGQEQQDQQDGQPGEGEPQEGQPDEQPGQLNELPQPGQRMTEEQARQLLAAIARDGETLQERLGQIFSVPWQPPVQDW